AGDGVAVLRYVKLGGGGLLLAGRLLLTRHRQDEANLDVLRLRRAGHCQRCGGSSEKPPASHGAPPRRAIEPHTNIPNIVQRAECLTSLRTTRKSKCTCT